MLDNGLNINSSELTHHDIMVTYKPLSDVISYSYQVIKDGQVIKTVQVNNNQQSNILLDQTGNYKIEITNYNGIEYTKVKSGTYKISKEITSTVVDSNNKVSFNPNLVISQIFVVSILFIILIYLIRYNYSLKLEKRFSKYTVKSLKKDNKSLFKTFGVLGNSIIDKITKVISKSTIIQNISIRYDKYVKAFNQGSNIRFIAKKVLVSFIFLLVGFIVATIRLETLNIYEIVILLIVGYYALDIVYKYKYYIYCKQIENDLLQAIVIMNNAFKSGRSITQAIMLVADELKGPISDEFHKIYQEIDMGLDIEMAFKRFSSRINTPEATYLTSSIAILNKTGGNIVKVFSSIEKTLYNRKKLRIELKELTGSSRIVMWVLSVVPIAFTALILIINKDYFNILFTNFLGILIIGAIIVLYVGYIIIVRKIMKIKV